MEAKGLSIEFSWLQEHGHRPDESAGELSDNELLAGSQQLS